MSNANKGKPRFTRKAGSESKAQTHCSNPDCGVELTPHRRVHVHGEGTLCYPCWQKRWAND